MKEEEIDFRNFLQQGDLELNVYAQELTKKLREHEKADLYPPRFRAIINQQPTATWDLNFKLNISNADRQISFHVVTFSGSVGYNYTQFILKFSYYDYVIIIIATAVLADNKQHATFIKVRILCVLLYSCMLLNSRYFY